MFPIVFEVKLEGIMTVRNRRKFRSLIKLAMRLMLHEWHRRYFPLHFKATAYHRYPGVYKRRVSDKRKKRHRGRPNILTGTMMRQLERSFRVTGTITKMEGRMRGPDYTDVRRPGRPDKAAEITTMNPIERRKLAQFMEEMLGELIEQTHETRKMRIAA